MTDATTQERSAQEIDVQSTRETIFEQMFSCIDAAQTICLSGHVSPDGDCLGSLSALASLLHALGKEVDVLLAKPESIACNLSFLPHINEAFCPQDMQLGKRYDLSITCDVPTIERLGAAGLCHKQAKKRLTLDHHPSLSPLSDLNCIDTSAPACALIVWDFIRYSIQTYGITLEHDTKAAIAAACYTGLMTDTGRFQYQNTNEDCFRAAAEMFAWGANPSIIARDIFQNNSLAHFYLTERVIHNALIDTRNSYAISYVTQKDLEELGADKSDTEGLVDVLRSLRGVSLVAFMREVADDPRSGDTPCFKVSFRSKDNLDVASIAVRYNGGGHRVAAGASFYCELDEALDCIKHEFENLQERQRGNNL